MEPLLLSKRQSAKLLGICVRTLDKEILSGAIPIVHIGVGKGRVLLSVEAIQGFIRARERTRPVSNKGVNANRR